MTRRFAETTDVPVAKTRGHIQALLTVWGCTGIGWYDDFDAGHAQLHFRWPHEGVVYSARFTIKLPSTDEIRAQSKHARTSAFLPARFERMKQNVGRQEHRVLYLWLKGAMNAVDAGIVDPASVFLAFLVGKNGQTLGELAIPRLAEIHSLPNAGRLLDPAKETR